MGLGLAGTASSHGRDRECPLLSSCVGGCKCLCFRMFAAVLIWNSRAGKEIVFNFPEPGRAAQFWL